MDTEITTQNPKNAVSIDHYFPGIELRKGKAVEQIQEHNIRHKEDLEFIAKSIYETTFRTAANLRFGDSDEKGNRGCIDPFVKIYDGVLSYGVKETEYSTASLAKPAFWFAKEHIIESRTYQKKNPSSPKPKYLLIWRLKDDLEDISVLYEEYIKLFEKSKPYMVSNLTKALNLSPTHDDKTAVKYIKD